MEGWGRCIWTPIDKIPRYITQSRKCKPLLERAGSFGQRERMHFARASKRRIYFAGRAIVSARHRKTDTRNNTTRRDAYTRARARAHVNENTPTRNTASLKARKKSQTRLNVDAGRQIFFVRDTNDRCICDDAIREIRRWKTQSGNQIVPNSSE